MGEFRNFEFRNDNFRPARPDLRDEAGGHL